MDRERILVVDDLEPNRLLLTDLLEAEGYRVEQATNGDEALASVRAAPPDLILLDAVMPNRDGFSVARILKANPATRLVPIVMVTALTAMDDKLHAVSLGVDDFLTKPINAPELRARVRSLLSLKHFTDELEHASRVLETLAIAVEKRDGYTGQHCKRVGAYARRMGERLGLDAASLEVLRLGGIFHDIGKVTISDAILRKSSDLDDAERGEMAVHAVAGAEICAPMRTLKRVVPIIRHHHERLDGSGYPDGLEADQVPLVVRIVTVVDIYDALTTWRPYREALPPATALATLREEARRGWWDESLVEELARLLADDAHTPKVS